ncbi:MAG: hypothetical protein R3362_05210, partial [Rhodothermales bacterium]|nr:hypothetical protein [Rhodothermales bacterium]
AQEPLARPSVLVALGASGHAASAGLVVAALADEDAVVRLAATEALAALDVPDGLPLFLPAHADAEAEARPVVLAALVRWLDAHPDAAADLPAGLEDALAAMLDDPDPALREAAARGFRYVAHRLEPARLLAPAGRDDALDVALFDALVARPDPFGTLVDAGGAVAPAAAASFAAALLAQGHVAEPDVDRVGRFLHGRFGALDGDTKLAVLELCARRRHPALARVLDAGLADPDAVVHAAAADLMPARTPADPGASA